MGVVLGQETDNKGGGDATGPIVIVLISLAIVSAVGFFFVQRHRKGLPLIPSPSERGRFGAGIRDGITGLVPGGGGNFTRFSDGGGSSRGGRRARTMPTVNVVAPPSDGGAGGYQAPALTAPLSMGAFGKGSVSLTEPLSLGSIPLSAPAGQSQL